MIQQHVFLEAWFFIVGSVVGSFVNVVIYRLPRGESVVWPGSKCSSCGVSIKAYNNIPIISWFVLRGKCADCGAPYSFRYPMVELITALLFTACYAKFGLTVPGVIYSALCAALVAIVFIDIDHLIIPDVITLPGIVIGFVFAALFLPITAMDSFFGLLAGGGVFFLLAVLVPGGMGGGDIKLMGMVGAFLGLKSAFLTIFLGSLLGSIGGLAGIIAFGKGRKSKIPFGPYLSVAAIASILFKDELINFYLRLIGG
jgi:leader peptidase (prepilin peptidase)/N-methyltransferase